MISDDELIDLGFKIIKDIPSLKQVIKTHTGHEI